MPSIVEYLLRRRRKLKARAARIEMYNAKPQNFRLCVQKMEEYGFIPWPQPL
jgi:hypothetical protein